MSNTRQCDFDIKLERLRRYLKAQDFSSAIIGRRDNFAWLTTGGDNKVVRSSETGFGFLVVTQSRVTLVAHTMDATRILDDELSETDVDLFPVKWYESTREEKARLLCGAGQVISDIPISNAMLNPAAFYALHYPLTRDEIGRACLVAAESEKILRRVADLLTPEMTELEVAALLGCEYERQQFGIDVLLVGGSRRVGLYRHPLPSQDRIGDVVLLHPAVNRWGLHANITRMVCFGDVIPAELERKYTALAEMQAAAIAMCEPGRRYRDVLEERKRIYLRHGYPDEWQYHFAGGPTGYVLAQGDVCADESATVSDGQLFDWFITITGAKVEELGLVDGDRRELISAAGAWPTREISYREYAVDTPWLLLR